MLMFPEYTHNMPGVICKQRAIYETKGKEKGFRIYENKIYLILSLIIFPLILESAIDHAM